MNQKRLLAADHFDAARGDVDRVVANSVHRFGHIRPGWIFQQGEHSYVQQCCVSWAVR